MVKKILVFICLSCWLPTGFTAQRIELKQPSLSILRNFLVSQGLASGTSQSQLKEINRHIDSNRTLHVRFQQTFAGYPVLGANGVMHLPGVMQPENFSFSNLLASAPRKKASVNGVLYQHLQEDLQPAPSKIFTPAQAQLAKQVAIRHFQSVKARLHEIKYKKSELMVFVDKNNKAHWVYKVSFYADANSLQAMPAYPIYLLDAASLKIYKTWNDIKTMLAGDEVEGGGYGGNYKVGKVYYDGLVQPGHRGKLHLLRDSLEQKCFFKSQQVIVKTIKNKQIINFPCLELDRNHNSVYWSENLGAYNGGFSTNNDVMYAGQVVYDMYKNWYDVAPFSRGGKALPVVVFIHVPAANAFWNAINKHAYFGDGSESMFPYTGLDVVAHELSHGFTEQHANLEYQGEAGGINESFSDMAAITAMYFAEQKPSWQIGASLLKNKARPLRWLDKPSQDGYSIDNAKDFDEEMDVHHSSGVFNKAFYLLATTPGWNIRKAFGVMVQANRYYWTSTSSFREAACGVVSATNDLAYAVKDVAAAFKQVGINTSSC